MWSIKTNFHFASEICRRNNACKYFLAGSSGQGKCTLSKPEFSDQRSLTHLQLNTLTREFCLLFSFFGGCKKKLRVPVLKECKSPRNTSPPSIDLHGVSVRLSVACRDDYTYTSPHKATQGGLIFRGTFIPTTPAVSTTPVVSTGREILSSTGNLGLHI